MPSAIRIHLPKMNTWQELVTLKAPLATAFPDCAITELSHLGLIRAGGSELRGFLQGQLTNDIHAVTAQTAQLSSYCSPKGRMLGSFWIFQRGDDLYLQLSVERLGAILKRLQMFVLRADVRLEDASGELARLGIAGECAAGLLPFAPDQARACETRDGITVLRLPGDRPRFEVIGEPAALAALWTGLAEQAEQVGPDFWSLLDIRAGIPNVYDDTAEAFVPQMANLQLVDGVSFSKGCYTGQEIVARMQYLGTLKRRMYLAHIAAGERPAPGTEVFPATGGEQAVGRLVDAAPSPEGGFEALAVVQIADAESDALHLAGPAGARLTLRPLPYAYDPAGD